VPEGGQRRRRGWGEKKKNIKYHPFDGVVVEAQSFLA